MTVEQRSKLPIMAVESLGDQVEEMVKGTVEFIKESITDPDFWRENRQEDFEWEIEGPLRAAQGVVVNDHMVGSDLLDLINDELGVFTFGGVDYFVNSDWYNRDTLLAAWENAKGGCYSVSLFEDAYKVWNPYEVVQYKDSICRNRI